MIPSSGEDEKPVQARRMFTKEEDDLIRDTIERFGHKKWSTIAKYVPGRCPRQVRERWINYLDPTINRGPFSEEEDALLYKLVKEYGTQWNTIVPAFPGRTEVIIKNRWSKLRGNSPELKEIKSQRGRKSRNDKIVLDTIAIETKQKQPLPLVFHDPLPPKKEKPGIASKDNKAGPEDFEDMAQWSNNIEPFLLDETVPSVIDQIVYF